MTGYFFKLLKPKPNVPKTDYQKSLRDLKIQVQKTKGGAAKLRPFSSISSHCRPGLQIYGYLSARVFLV